MWDKMTKFTPLEDLVKEDMLENLTKIENNIWVIKNFISEEDRLLYTNYIDNLKEDDWWNHTEGWWAGKAKGTIDSPTLIGLSKKLSKKVESFLKDDIHLENIYLDPFAAIHRIQAGQKMFIHTDNHADVRDVRDEYGNKIGTTSGENNYCVLGMILYLNEFNGGEIYFPTLKIKYKSSAGDLVFFPGVGKEYDHGVKEVLPGPTRYVATCFGHYKKF